MTKFESTDYTRGPWRVVRPRLFKGFYYVQDKQLRYIAEIHDWNGQGRANAYLIAAAPDLLEAFNNLVGEVVSKWPHAEDTVVIRQARDAIAKATTGK
jgi:hypothetical protein